MKRIITVIALMMSALASAFAQNGQIVDDKWLTENYTRREVMIEMRDGKHIYTAIYEPVQQFLEKLGKKAGPIMLFRTPYGLKPYGLKPGQIETEGKVEKYPGGMKWDMANYAAEGWIIVQQNVRGKFLSEGEYENMRPYVSGPDGAADTVVVKGVVQVDDATDVYDSIEWLLKNTKNNGNVGVKGVSYPGFYTTLAALSRHPAIKAASPQAPATDWFMGDDAHHNGALCLADACRFGSSFYRYRPCPSTESLGSILKIDKDLYEFYLGRPLKELDAFLGDSLRFWNQMMEHPDYDRFWKDRDPSVHLKDIRIPMLVTGGFYDAEDCYGAFRTYEMLKTMSPDCELYLAAGPWYHGGWNNRTANHLADVWYGEKSGAYYQDSVEFPFFSYYLEGKGVKPVRVNVCPSGESMRSVMEGRSMAEFWESYDEWPPKNMKFNKLYLSGHDSLSFRSMTSAPSEGTRTITSDPASPVPYMDVKSTDRDRSYMVADQSFASVRKDVATYRGAELKSNIHVAGPVKVRMDLVLDSENGGNLDADVIVKLIDVRPDGYQMLVRGDVMPLRFRNGFGKPESVKSGKRVTVEFTMCDIDHHFVQGHSIMVQVQGSWFPLIAMNPQKFLKNPYAAESADYQKVDMTIRSVDSYLELPVVQEFQ